MFAIIAVMMVAMATVIGVGCEVGEMLPLLKRHEIQILLSVGMPPTLVAERVGVSVDTIERVRREDAVSHVDDAAERRRRGIGRPPKAARFTEDVQRWLEEAPETPTQELLRRAIAGGYDGGKSAFYALVAAGRPQRAAPVVRFEGLPGEFSQHDFGHVDVRYVDGRKERVLEHLSAAHQRTHAHVVCAVRRVRPADPLPVELRHHHAALGIVLARHAVKHLAGVVGALGAHDQAYSQLAIGLVV